MSRRLLADIAYDSDTFRACLNDQGCEAIIPSNGSRAQKLPLDKELYKARSEIECTFSLLKQARRFEAVPRVRQAWPRRRQSAAAGEATQPKSAGKRALFLVARPTSRFCSFLSFPFEPAHFYETVRDRPTGTHTYGLS